MKKSLLSFLALALLFTLLSQPLAAADDEIRIGVLRFTNQTAAGWWRGSVGTELQDMLASELVSTKAFSVLERKEIDAVLGEQDLSASGRVSSSTKVKMKKLKGAQYLVAGTVSAYEEDVSGQKGGVRFKGVSLGGQKEQGLHRRRPQGHRYRDRRDRRRAHHRGQCQGIGPGRRAQPAQLLGGRRGLQTNTHRQGHPRLHHLHVRIP